MTVISVLAILLLATIFVAVRYVRAFAFQQDYSQETRRELEALEARIADEHRRLRAMVKAGNSASTLDELREIVRRDVNEVIYGVP